MARIASVVIPSEKQVWIALTYVYGIGRTTSKAILAEAKIEPTTRVKDLTEAEENKIREITDQEIESEQIGEFVIPLLMELDEVAYIRFASVYRQFHSRESFLKELQALQDRLSEKNDKK